MTEGPAFRRGDVVLVAFPFVTEPTRSKRRPAVVIQNDTGNRFSPNLIVAYVSSQLPKSRYPTDYWVTAGSTEALAAGLDRSIVVKSDTLFTVPKVGVVRVLGRFPDEAMAGIDACLRVSLALPATAST